ncbi:MAG: 50S ribosomal protein L16 [Microgenomates group bacterium GW2011_GWA2_46_7]|nr:MAG: 50S ribosomal protein L16 [Microgenomates group bacterium GW2011_GWA2_46_7]
MMQPKKSKYRKEFRGTMDGIATRGADVEFGEYGLKVTESSWITAAQIEAARRTITHHTKRGGKLWLRIFPHKPLTHKAAGSKMGSGKGDIDKYTAVVKRGTIVFELGSIDEATAREAFRKAASKLPVLSRFVVRGAI